MLYIFLLVSYITWIYFRQPKPKAAKVNISPSSLVTDIEKSTQDDSLGLKLKNVSTLISANIPNKERKDKQLLTFAQKEMKPFSWHNVYQENVQMLQPQQFFAKQENRSIKTIKEEDFEELNLSEDFGEACDIRNTSTPIVCYENSDDDSTLHRRSVSKVSSAQVVDENNNSHFTNMPLTRENLIKFTIERDEIYSNSRSIFLIQRYLS